MSNALWGCHVFPNEIPSPTYGRSQLASSSSSTSRPLLLELQPVATLRRIVRQKPRHNSVPYSLPRLATNELLQGIVSLDLAFSPTGCCSNLSDTEKSTDGDNDQSILLLIPKPAGEAGKANSGSYNLERSLGWTKRRYEEFEVSFTLWQVLKNLAHPWTDTYQDEIRSS